MRAITAALLLLCVACQHNQYTSKDEHSEDAEIAFVAAVLRQQYSKAFARGESLLVLNEFSLDVLAYDYGTFEGLTRELLAEVSDSLPKELVRDFCSKNSVHQVVWPHLREHLPVVLIGSNEIDSIWADAGNVADVARDRLKAKYPKCKNWIISISRVGFNSDHSMAMFYEGGSNVFGPMAEGVISVYHKEGPVWVRHPTSFYWIT